MHATNHFNVLGQIRGSSDNLQMAIDGGTYEVNEMYPAFNTVEDEALDKCPVCGAPKDKFRKF